MEATWKSVNVSLYGYECVSFYYIFLCTILNKNIIRMYSCLFAIKLARINIWIW